MSAERVVYLFISLYKYSIVLSIEKWVPSQTTRGGFNPDGARSIEAAPPKTHVPISKRGMNAISLARGLASVAPSRNAPGRLRIAFQPSGLGGTAGRLHVLAVGFQRTEVEGRKGAHGVDGLDDRSCPRFSIDLFDLGSLLKSAWIVRTISIKVCL